MNRLSHLISAGLLALAAGAATAADALPQPARVFSERNGGSAAAVKLAALRYAAFWNTGTRATPSWRWTRISSTARCRKAAARHGWPLQASQTFRAAVPDLKVEVTDMVLAADRVALRLHFTGHFSGKFGDIQGSGQAVDFQAFDLYRVKNGRIAENWHLEDNLTLLKQLGALKP
ncbi:Predicted ester cyclase [Chromobacterium violaceum]|uniref:Predicted ester cyclase n=1 Tax=Chromobacterium violaceum TaxID=536 RepID=A0A3S4IHF2_CHRVL|nr:Predicted ester cyclase [Chromobacterium violaceum]